MQKNVSYVNSTGTVSKTKISYLDIEFYIYTENTFYFSWLDSPSDSWPPHCRGFDIALG
jgi:hypothetical protein